MESGKYYVLGNDEYNIYKTEDNGKTWNRAMINEGDVATANNGFGRIIIYSVEDMGLKYTDDGFATIENSNVTDGNWKAVEVELDEKGNPVTNDIYASSLDGRGIWVTHDFGEVWEFFSKGTASKLNQSGDSIILSGDNDVIKADKDYAKDKEANKPQVFPNSKYIPSGDKTPGKEPGSIKPQLKDNQLKGGLLYILNKVIIPQLLSILTGESNMEDLVYNNSTETYKKFWTDGQVYKVTPNKIDFYADVGMRPFHVSDIPDYNEVQKAANQAIIDINTVDKEQEITDTLKKTYSIIDRALNNYKSFILSAEGNMMANQKENYDGLTEEEIPTMKFFYDIKKGAIMSVKGTIINSVFTFDNSKKAALLKTSIMETANFLKGTINADLQAVSDKMEKDLIKEPPEGMFQYDLKSTWMRCLYKCLEDYYRECRKNINNISEDEDREYIAIAATKYKSIREDLLNEVLKIVNSLHLPECERTTNIQESVSENFELFQRKILACLDLYRSSISEGHPIPRGEMEKTIDDILEEYKKLNDKLREREKDYAMDYMSVEIRKEFKKRMQEEINPTNKELSNKFYFTQEDYDEELLDLTPAELEKVNVYYNMIMNRFKERCNNLLELIANGDIKKKAIEDFDIYPELYDFSDGLKMYYVDFETYLNSHSLQSLGGSTSLNYSIYLDNIIREWKKRKEII